MDGAISTASYCIQEAAAPVAACKLKLLVHLIGCIANDFLPVSFDFSGKAFWAKWCQQDHLEHQHFEGGGIDCQPF